MTQSSNNKKIIKEVAVLKKMSVKEQQTVVGGAVWVCLTCGYISHDHIFVETAKATAYDHERRYRGHKTIVRA